MTEHDSSKFEGMTLAKLAAIEQRLDEALDCIRGIESRCMAEHAGAAELRAELRAVREKADANARAIWAAVVWILLTAAGAILAALGIGR